MERKIAYSDVQRVVDEAYELYKSEKEGRVDSRASSGAQPGKFGISLRLADGRYYDKGDADVQFTLGPIVKEAIAIAVLQQYSLTDIVKPSWDTPDRTYQKKQKPSMPFSRRGLIELGMLAPKGDREGKMNLVQNLLYALTGAEPAFDEALYQSLKKETDASNLGKQLTDAGIKVDDDPTMIIDIYERLLALKYSAKDLAVMGAAIAADGRNPISSQYAFDGSLAADAVAMMAVHGKHFVKKWMQLVGIPAKKSDSGAIFTVIPGVGSIVAYSPEVDGRGVSVKGAKAIQHIATKLGLSIYASAQPVIE